MSDNTINLDEILTSDVQMQVGEMIAAENWAALKNMMPTREMMTALEEEKTKLCLLLTVKDLRKSLYPSLNAEQTEEGPNS